MTDEEERDETEGNGPASDREQGSSTPPKDEVEDVDDVGEDGRAHEEGDDGDGDDDDDEELRRLLRGALSSEEPSPSSDVLAGVQKRLRERSRGKFYADGWSTERHPPTMTYLWTSLIMLAIALVLWAALGSLSGEALEVNNEPAPVRIIHPRAVPSR